jgi:predicted RNA-binding Zn-ribbon protein involved in translation (DUF1610 family)
MSCPSCGKTLSAPETAAGKRAKCPACGQIMIVPAEGVAAEMSSAPLPPPSTLSPRAARAPDLPSEGTDFDPPSNQVTSSTAPGGGESWLDELGGPDRATETDAGGAIGEARRPCPECGEMIVAGAAKCRFCGAAFDPRLRRAAGRPGKGQSYNGMAVTSMVTGIVAYPGLCVYAWPGIILSIIAIIFGGIALSGMRRSGNDEGKGMAIAGLVLGLVVIALAILAVIAFVFMAASFGPRRFH